MNTANKKIWCINLNSEKFTSIITGFVVQGQIFINSLIYCLFVFVADFLKNLDFTRIAIRYCCIAIFLFYF